MIDKVVKRRNLCQCLTKFYLEDFAQYDPDGLDDVISAAEALLKVPANCIHINVEAKCLFSSTDCLWWLDVDKCC